MESYDGLFGSPGGFNDALSWHDSALYSGSELSRLQPIGKVLSTRFILLTVSSKKKGDVTTGWNKNERGETLGF